MEIRIIFFFFGEKGRIKEEKLFVIEKKQEQIQGKDSKKRTDPIEKRLR